MSDYSEAIKAAIEHLLKRKQEAERKREWAFNACVHERINRLVTTEAIHDVCEDCGAERTTFAIP